MKDYYSTHIFNTLLPSSWFVNVVGGNTITKSGYSSVWGIITNWRPAFISTLEAEQRAALTKHNAKVKAKLIARKQAAEKKSAKQALMADKNESTFFERIKEYTFVVANVCKRGASSVAVKEAMLNLSMTIKAWYEYKSTMTLEMSIRFALARQLLKTTELTAQHDHMAHNLNKQETAWLIATPVIETVKAILAFCAIVAFEALKILFGPLYYGLIAKTSFGDYLKLGLVLPLYRLVRQVIHAVISVIDVVNGCIAVRDAINLPVNYNRALLEENNAIIIHGNLVWAMQNIHRVAAIITNVKKAITPAFTSFRNSSASTGKIRTESDFTVELSSGKPIISGHLSMARI